MSVSFGGLVPKEEIEDYKRRVQELTRYLETTGQILGVVLEAEFKAKEE